MTFKQINFLSLSDLNTHAQHFSFSQVELVSVNCMLPKETLQFSQVEASFSIPSYKRTQLYLISIDVISTDDCTECSEIFVLQCGVSFHCGMTLHYWPPS